VTAKSNLGRVLSRLRRLAASRLARSGFNPSRYPHLEIRNDDKGEFDELCVTFADGTVHMETMDTDSCYIGFYWDDGRYCQLWFGIKNRKNLWYNHDHGTSDPPRYTALGVDRKPWMPDYGALAASAMSDSAQDAQRLDPKGASATREAGDAQ
jgi:hypothetical protein